jgi:NAD(P)-dependent dehydrogenase (short-subunit alcohol dehydrogenase family)
VLLDFSSRAGAALVVGATGGIGAAVARRLAGAGSALALTYHRNAAAAAELAEALPALTRHWQLDLTDAGACESVVDAAARAFGGLHTVVYAAGPHVPMVHLSRVAPQRFGEQVAQDTIAFFNLVAAALPRLRDTHGNLVAVTTAATRRHPPRDGLSTGPKAAVEALVRGIAVEEGRYGVRANCVGPGMTTAGNAVRLMADGDLDAAALDAARAAIPLRRFGTADDVAAAVCFLASDAAGYVTGQKLDVDGGYTA